MNVLHLDVETCSRTPIAHGLDRYFADPGYKLLMVGWAPNNDPGLLWVLEEDGGLHGGGGMPAMLIAMLLDPEVEIHAHNAEFEWHALNHPTFSPHLQQAWDPLPLGIPLSRFRCTRVGAYAKGFSGSLGDIQEQIGASPDKTKLKTGKQLINLFCVPRKNGGWNDRHTHPGQWEEFKRYCIQDVKAERDLERLLSKYPPLSDQEREHWLLSHRINQRGLPIDRDLVRCARRVERQHKTRNMGALKEITGLANPNSQPQFLGWLRGHQYPVTAIPEEVLKGVIENPSTSADVRRACELRLLVSKTSNTRWTAIENATGTDGRIRNCFRFVGASRTGRFAGRILTNLPASEYKDGALYEAAVGSIRCEDARLLDAMWGDSAQLLRQSIRGAVTARPGKKLVVVDYVAVEVRMIGWLSGCTRMNELFAAGGDPYKDFARELFRVSYNEVTQEQRKFSKAPILGGIYRLAGEGLRTYAEGRGVSMSLAEAERAVATLRETYFEIPRMWYGLERMLELVLTRRVEVAKGFGVQMYLVEDMLLIVLPSGRPLFYYQPRWEKAMKPWGKLGWGFSYMGMHQKTHKWVRLQSHGGKVTENIDQAASRDLLTDALARAERQELNPIGHFHDEIICEAEETQAGETLAALKTIMSEPPAWASGLNLAAAGWIGNRYRKD